jgi:hypothetical protein
MRGEVGDISKLLRLSTSGSGPVLGRVGKGPGNASLKNAQDYFSLREIVCQ